MRKTATILILLGLFTIASALPVTAGDGQTSNTVGDAEDDYLPVLPRWREGGTPYNPQQSLYPYVISSPRLKDMPTGYIASPPEYDPCRGVLFYYVSSQWPTVVRDLVVALTADPLHDEIAYVVVPSSSQQTSATNAFVAGGADMSKVRFFIEPGNALWIRDYGPHFAWQNGNLMIVDSHYYPSRPLDNFIPTLLGDDHFLMPTYDMGLYYSGGNFQPGPRRTGFATALLNSDNPTSEGFDEAFIAELFQTYQGIDSLHIMPQLPPSVDGTGHIDMWMYLVDSNTVIISKFKEGSNATAIQITDNAVPYMQALGFEVYRTPAWNVGATHYTYTNAFRVNDRIFIPTYGEGNSSYLDEDAEALASWEAAAGPDVEIVPIDCYDIIPAAGAIHCIVMQVPRYVGSAPSACVISPKGGELLISGTTHDIEWVATDTDNDSIPRIDLYYSTNGGLDWEYIDSTADDGSYQWAVPNLRTDQALVKVVATSQDLDQGEAVSADVFQIAPGSQTVYDFSTGAGVNKFGYGYRSYAWSYVDGNRTPVTTEIGGSNYPKIAYSDATGGDTDPNRYIAQDPSTSYESTHIFEFTIGEDPSEIDDIDILWEGYADQCTQIELYVWDYVEANWGDGEGLWGQNRFMDNWAGNRDGYLERHIRSDFDRYVAPGSGQMTLLLYAERSSDPSFHDYVTVKVSTIAPEALCGDANGDEMIDVGDVVRILNYLYKSGPEPDCIPITACGDVNLDGIVDVADAIYILNYLYKSGTEPCNPASAT
jgi:agmatine/peptidylarginine deiminase